MSFFKEYIKDISLVLVFISFVEIIIPDRRYKEFIKLFLGGLLILSVIEPLNKVIQYDFSNLDVISFDNQKFEYNDVTEELLREEVLNLLQEKEVAKVEFRDDNIIIYLRINKNKFLSIDEERKEIEDVKSIISSFYNIDEKNIIIYTEEE